MHRFYLPPEHCCGMTLTLSGREAHHASHVLRVAPSERVMVLDGAGHEILCEVQQARRDALTLAVIEKNRVSSLPHEITLIQAIPKGKIIESIVQKATELGVRRIIPLLAERVITHLDEETAAGKADKWQQAAIE